MDILAVPGLYTLVIAVPNLGYIGHSRVCTRVDTVLNARLENISAVAAGCVIARQVLRISPSARRCIGSIATLESPYATEHA